MTKTIIFDLNGVFIRSPKLSERFRDDLGIPTEKFLPALEEIMSKARLPNAGDSYVYWRPYLDKWGVNLPKEQFFNFWFSAEKEIPEMIEMVRQLKKQGIRIFILSNNFVERANYYDQHFPFLKEIPDKIYYSWQTGFVKPAKEAYENLLTDNNLKAEECIYFDDSKENIEVASKLGIKSHIFKDLADLESELRNEFKLEIPKINELNHL